MKKILYLLTIGILFPVLIDAQAPAQFQIVGMTFDGRPVNQVVLGVANNGVTSRTNVNLNSSYYSGTTLITPARTNISVYYKGQKQIVSPNSSLQLSISNLGVVAKSNGKVQHVLNDVKNKIGFYKAGDGFTWAHAKGTNFFVESYNNGGTKFSTIEGSVGIVEKVAVSINEQSKVNVHGKSALETTVKSYSSAGSVYQTGNNRPIVYRTYADAINDFVKKTLQKEKAGGFYYDEIGQDFFLIGRLFVQNGQRADAVYYLRRALTYVQMASLNRIENMDIYMELVYALISSGNINLVNEGRQLANIAIPYLISLINPKIAEYNNAIKYNDKDLAWHLCFDVSDIYDYLSDAYYDLNDTKSAEFYEQQSDKWFDLLEHLEK